MAQLITANNIDPATLNVISGPRIVQIQYPGDDTAAAVTGGQTITLTGAGFQTGATVYVDSVVVGVTTVISSTTLSFVAPAKVAGNYALYVVNPDGATATFLTGIQYSGVPAWSTAAGSLGTVYETQAVNYVLSAASDSTVSYSVTSGTLAAGAALDASTGAITGNANLVAGSTTYNFTVDAVDQEQQNTSRNFSITVDPDVVTFNSPADGATYSNLTGDVFSLTLNATSIMGKTVSYTANVLPGGLSIVGSAIAGTFNTVATTASLITATADTTLKTATRLLNWAVTAPPPTEVNYGWFGGRRRPSIISTVERIDYSNDTGTHSIRGPLSLARYGAAAAGNNDYGWFFGGGSPSYSTRVDRISYAADTGTALVRGGFTYARALAGATGNTDYGWFGGGIGDSSVGVVNRIDYANDGVASSVRGNIRTTYLLAATGNAEYGWFGGGNPSNTTTVNRIIYSADTTVAGTRGPLSLGRLGLTATGNADYGWFGAGNATPGVVSRVDRINYASDTTTASVRGPLTQARYTLSATGNSNYGWFGGGYSQTTVDRIDYTADTASASVRGALSAADNYAAATGGFPG